MRVTSISVAKLLLRCCLSAALPIAARRQFQREAQALALLNHPNIAVVYDFDSDAGTDFLVMEYIRGETLRSKLERGSVPLPQLLSTAVQMTQALGAAHAKNIVHRDLKPGNLMITEEGHLKILDFGLAQFVHRTGPNQSTDTISSDSVGISGTLAYMAPEQLHGWNLDPRTDIWAAGIVFYEMATGQWPFAGNTPGEMAGAVLNHAPALLPELPVVLQPIVQRCLEKQPEKRYQSAGELLADLQIAQSEKTLSPPPCKKSRLSPRTILVIVLLAAALLAGGIARRYFRYMPTQPAVPNIRSLAVLPLADLSGNTGQEYFSDGMTDAIINELARASNLNVISRTSVLRYKHANKTVPEIARELGVDAVIEGSVVRLGERVRINAQIIYAPTESTLWSDSFDRDTRDVLSLQSEIAHSITRQLRVRLGEEQTASRPPSVNPEAYDALLKARFYTYRLTSDDLAKAEQYAREAIGRQPDMGDAYHILSEILWFQGMNVALPSVADSRRLLEDSRAAAEKAIALGANAHSTYALLVFTLDGDSARAEREYELSIELQPNKSSVHGHYGVFLAMVGRCSEARKELLRAVELDPTGEFALSIAGEFLMYCKDLQSAEHYIRAALDLNPNYNRAHYLLQTVFFLQHRIPEMLAETDHLDMPPEDVQEIRRVLQTTGESGYRRRTLQRALKDPRQSQRAINLGSAYALAGNRQQALHYLEAATKELDPRMYWVRAYPQFWFLWGEPRFNAILAKLGLPQTPGS